MVIGKVQVEDWVFLFIGKDSEHLKNLLGLHIQKKYSFEHETRPLQVYSGLNRMFISITSSYPYQIKRIKNDAVIIAFFSYAYVQEDAAHGALQPQVINFSWEKCIFFLLCSGLGTTVGQIVGVYKKTSRGALEMTVSVLTL